MERDVKAVIFDLDNTLLDRQNTFLRFADSFAQYYFPHIADRWKMVERIVELDEDGYKDKRTMFGELLEELPWAERPELQQLMAYYEEHYVAQSSLMEGALEILEHVRGRYKVGLITNGSAKTQHGKIDRLQLRELFDVILVSGEAGVKKPERRIFEMAVERLGVAAEECVYIGDHPLNDVEGAGKAGMGTIWLEVNQPWDDRVTVEPLHRVKRLAELAGLL